MKGNYSTDFGRIVVDNSVIAKMAGLTAVECFGIVGMAALSKRDGIVKLLTRNSIAKGVKVEIENNELFIDFHVIVAYGVSIATISQNLVDAVKYQLEQATGFTVKKINIIVEGVRVID
ncbi:MAG: Asp23/Gls24 family envelope stress response protein [Lachnospiraceae bacterium]|nr:Asp23/Gls24 family envelope stress response protein [Lachnospiraceae bacterium]